METHQSLPRPGIKDFGICAPRLILATLFINILSLALPVLTLQVYDRIIPHPESGTLPVLIAGVVIAVFFDTALRLARASTIGWNGLSYEHTLSCQAMDHMLKADPAQFEDAGTGRHLARISAIPRLKDFNSGFSMVTLLELAFLPLYLGLIAYIAGPLVAVPLAMLALFTLSSLWYGTRLKRALIRRDHTDDERYNFLIESLEGIHTIKAFALDDNFQRRYEKLEDRSTMANFQVTEVSARTFNSSTVCSHALTAAVVTYGAYLVVNGHMTSGALIAAILLSGRIIQPVQMVLSLWARYQDYCVARQKVLEIFSLPQIKRKALKEEEEPARQGALVLRDVGFQPDPERPPVFSHVNLSLARGESLRISGAHGAGKTALLNIISGLYTPSHGEVLLDGMPAHHYPSYLRLRHVGFMTTKGAIFRGTIRDNITRFGLVDMQEAQDISRLLGLDKEVSALPRGFDTFLEGTETDAIPPGLAQRITLARVLAEKPRVILFDNADRNLDREGYRYMYRLIGRLRDKAALILVTDDLNIGRLADRHYTLDAQGLRPVSDFHDNIMYGELRA